MPTLIFQAFGTPPASFPHADLGAKVVSTMMQVALDGARFPPTFCDPAFATCADPTM